MKEHTVVVDVLVEEYNEDTCRLWEIWSHTGTGFSSRSSECLRRTWQLTNEIDWVLVRWCSKVSLWNNERDCWISTLITVSWFNEGD